MHKIQVFGTARKLQRNLLLLGAALLACTGFARASEKDYCSLIVTVSGPNGQPLVAKVTVVDAAGHRLSARTSQEGKAEFCPLGMKPVDVTVGAGGCGSVTVQEVELFWEETQVLPITWAPCWLHGDGPPRTACSILLRVSDQQGDSIQGAAITTQYGPHPDLSDRYGRIRLGVGYGKTLEGKVLAAGFEEATYKVDCSRSEGDVEREVKLTGSAK